MPSLWQQLEPGTKPGGGDGAGIWSGLPASLDPMNRRLAPVTDYVSVSMTDSAGEERWILKNPARGTYASLSAHEFEIFKTLDPELSISDVCTKMVEEKSIFPFFILGPCLNKLYTNGFVENSNTFVFREVSEKIAARSWRRRLFLLFNRTVHLEGLDRRFQLLYDGFFRFLYLPIAVVLLHLAALGGMIGFFHFFLSGDYEVLRFPHGFLVEFPLLLLAQGAIIFCHELGHAFAVKASGREVDRGGMTLTLLLPVAFFVNTNDMWLERRKWKRIAVSWAGPMVNVLAVALCVALLFAFGDPSSLLSNVLYKTALISLLYFFLNLNPLLPTDGYYILMDYLEIPSLARRGNQFVRSGLWEKLKNRQQFTREERVLTLYGLLVAVWGVLATVITVLFFWGFLRFVLRLWQEGGWVLRSALAALATVILLPFCYFVFGLLDQLVNRALIYLYRRGFFHDMRKLVLLATGLTAVVIGPPTILHATGVWWFASADVYVVYCAFPAIGLAMSAIWTTRRLLEHRFHREVFAALACLLAVFVVERFLGALLECLDADAAALWCRALGALALGAILAGAGRWFLTFHQDRSGTQLGRVLTALGPIVSVPLAVPIAYLSREAEPTILVLFVLAAVLWSLGLSAWVNAYRNLRQGRFRLSLGIVLDSLIVGYVFLLASAAAGGPVAAFFGAVFSFVVLTGVLILHLDLSRINFERAGQTEDLLLPEEEKLRAAFAGFVDKTIEAVADYFGPRKAETIVRGANDHFVNRAYGIFILERRVLDQVPADSSVVERGRIYADAFGALVDQVVGECGAGFTDRLIENLYDSLFWAEREVVTNYIFRGRRWDKAGVVVTEDEDPIEFLRQIPLFYKFDETQLRLTLNACQMRKVHPGKELIREGNVDRDLFIIRNGIVDVFVKGQRVNTLFDGDYFGEVAIVEDRPRTATVVARTATECYVLGREQFDAIVRPALGPDFQMMSVIKRIGALRQFDLLGQTSPMALAVLMQRCEEKSFAAEERIIEQGEIGRHFYIILEGTVRVVLDADGPEPQKVATRRRGEYFGEIALIRQIPRTASVIAETDCELLLISKDDFDAFFKETQQITQFSSRRMAVLERLVRPQPV